MSLPAYDKDVNAVNAEAIDVKTSRFDNLPNDLLVKIGAHISTANAANMTKVNHQMKNVYGEIYSNSVKTDLQPFNQLIKTMFDPKGLYPMSLVIRVRYGRTKIQSEQSKTTILDNNFVFQVNNFHILENTPNLNIIIRQDEDEDEDEEKINLPLGFPNLNNKLIKPDEIVPLLVRFMAAVKPGWDLCGERMIVILEKVPPGTARYYWTAWWVYKEESYWMDRTYNKDRTIIDKLQRRSSTPADNALRVDQMMIDVFDTFYKLLGRATKM